MLATPQGAARCLECGPAEGRTVLLIHGLASISDEILIALCRPLVAAGFHVLAVDRPGYGGSEPLRGPHAGPAAQAQWLASVLRAMRAEVSAVVAHSFGAAVALYLGEALGRPPGALVLVNPFCRPTPPAAAPLLRLSVAPGVGPIVRRKVCPALARPLVRAMLANACAPDPVPVALRELQPQMLTREAAILTMAAELRGYNADMGRLPARGGQIAGRVLALSGSRDRVIAGASHGEWLRRAIPQVEHRCVEAGHMLHHARPDLIAEALGMAA
jgi:pimeloyl-ACP methyl ester carboxylesterase